MNELTTTLSDSEPIVETGINTKLLLEVADHIEQNYKRFNMETWRRAQYKPQSFMDKLLGRPKAACGTEYCIAGWTCKLAGAETDNPPATAQKLLGLTLQQCGRLFWIAAWPKYYQAYKDHPHTPEAAWVAAERIRHFVATNGEE